MTSSSGKEIEEIDFSNFICFKKKILSSSTESDYLSTGFHKHLTTRERELTNRKTTEGNYHVRIHLTDISSFAKHQNVALYCLRCKFTIHRKSNNQVLGHDEELMLKKLL